MRKTYESYLFANSNKQSAALAQREKRLQSVQYECIKRKLMEQFNKKAAVLNKRIAKKAQTDPHLLSFNATLNPAEPNKFDISTHNEDLRGNLPPVPNRKPLNRSFSESRSRSRTKQTFSYDNIRG